MPRPYEKTPIYQATREVLRETHAMTARMSQGYKYTLGEALRKAAMGAADVYGGAAGRLAGRPLLRAR